ncbi:MAG: MFS transporter [Alphaproteobacteria bacterium]|nr:MFS transporter [Alphaproteobacteria bacterium]
MLAASIVACALFMESLDGTVIATALPQIAESFDVSPIRLSLAITAYLLSLAVFMPASGWFADRFGARTVFRAAIAVFTLGSILCGMSDSVAALTASRFLQGAGGAMMVPVGRLVMLRSVEKRQLVRVMAYLAMPALLGPVLGPPVGGFLVTYASWRWIFFLNVPIGILGMIMVSAFIDNHRDPAAPPLDRLGFGLSALGLSGLMLGFETVGRGGVPALAPFLLIALGAVLGVLYLRHMTRTAQPILDLTLFRVPTFGLATAGGSLFRIGVGALPFLLPMMLQVGFGMSAFASGMLTFTAAIGAITMKAAAQPILGRFGFRRVLVVNALVCGAFFVSYATFQPTTPAWAIVALLLSGGFFRSLQFTAVNALAYADVPPGRMSRATSLSGTMQQLSLSFGVAVGAGLLHLTLYWRGAGETLTADDFWPAFTAIGVIASAAALVFRRLKAGAGAELTGLIAAQPSPKRLGG